LRKAILNIHLVLGLSSGLIVFIVAITGCLYAFKDEIESALQTYRYVEPQAQTYLSPSEMKKIGLEKIPGREIHGVAYNQPGYAAEIIFYEHEPLFYQSLFVNPYSGDIIHIKDWNRDFFRFILDGHFYLWLPPQIGQTVVASGTLIFVILLITGMILWWPKGYNVRQRFRVKWNASWRRKNFDLHSVLGFYISLVVLVLALTGLVWGFEWFRDAVYATAGGEKKLEFLEPPSVAVPATITSPGDPVDEIWYRMKAEYPDAASIEMHYPHDEKSTVYVDIKRDQDTYWRSDYRFFDQYTLQEIEPDHVWGRLDQATAADKLMRMNYDIHVGAILGLPGKILVFTASLIAASLPVTGFLLWIGRRKKEKRKSGPKAEKPIALKRRRRSVKVAEVLRSLF
jgi:uncharacterized iron-regulated membrane protein